MTYNLTAMRGICTACTLPFTVQNEVCINLFCGNGALDLGEMCDDSNNVNGDGCSDTCMKEIYCGNGFITSAENCDDNNTISNDGCSSC